MLLDEGVGGGHATLLLRFNPSHYLGVKVRQNLQKKAVCSVFWFLVNKSQEKIKTNNLSFLQHCLTIALIL